MFDLTVKAFNLADRFRVPTFLMSDEVVGHMRERVTIPDSVDITPPAPLAEGSLPYEAGDDGVPGFCGPSARGRSVHVTGAHPRRAGLPGYDRSCGPRPAGAQAGREGRVGAVRYRRLRGHKPPTPRRSLSPTAHRHGRSSR